MSRRTTTIPFVLTFALCSFGGARRVRSDEKPPAPSGDWKDGYTIGRQMAELEQRLARIEKLLAEQEERERNRAEVINQLLRALGAGPQSGDKTPVVLPAPKDQTAKPIETTAKPIETTVKPAAAAVAQKASFGTVSGTVRTGGERIDAFVYLDEVVGAVVKDKVLKIDQVNRQFSPRFVVVQKGTRIDFPNRDAIYHNVFSLSANNRFDLGYSRSGDIAPSHRFMTPGKIEIYCNMHSQMSAIVIVVPNDRYARVAEDGTFSLGRIPTGTRRFVLVAADGRVAAKVTDVEADAISNLGFDLPPPAPAQAHLRKDGQQYPDQY